MPLKRAADEEDDDPKILFRAVSVFDVQQVDPLDGVEPTPGAAL